MKPIRETDLYPPLRDWLENNGYHVHAEVGDCDIAARRGEELVLVEIKRAINLDLLLQAVRRQEADASVYVAVPAPDTVDKRWRELMRLLKRLELGLLVVYLESALPRVELAFHPVPQERRRRKTTTQSLLSEMSGRSLSLNQGGSNRRPVMTAYREQALGVAVALERLGPTSPKKLRAAGASQKAAMILRANHYGWFERVSIGQYGLVSAGKDAIAANKELTDLLRGKMHFDVDNEVSR